MSADQLFDLKQRFLHDAEVALRRQLTAAERVLLKLVFEKIIDQLTVQGGRVMPVDENFDVLNRLGSVFQQFIQDQMFPIAAKLATSFLRLPTLNGDYFQAEVTTPDVVAKVKRIVGASTDYLRSKLGLTASGKPKPGAYLTEISSIPQVRDDIRRIMAQVIDAGGDLQALRDRVRDYLIGGPVLRDGQRLPLRMAGAIEKRFEQVALDTLNAADRSVGRQFAVELGLQVAVYRGGIIEETRKFCCQLNGKAWTTDEMLEFDKEDWSGKKGAVQIDGGGYNCRHTWRYVNEVRALRLRPDLEEGPDGKLVPKAGVATQQPNDTCDEAKGHSTLDDRVASGAPVVPGKQLPGAVEPKHAFQDVKSLIDEIPTDKVEAMRDDDTITYQHWIAERQGFNGLPTIVDASTYDAYLNGSNVVRLFRGIKGPEASAKKAIEQLRTDPNIFPGRGVYGNGTYFGTSESVAISYASTKSPAHRTEALLDRSTARIGVYETLFDEYMKLQSIAWKQVEALPEAQRDDAARRYFILYGEFGSWATAKGYDAIHVRGPDYYVVLNRTKLVFKK